MLDMLELPFNGLLHGLILGFIAFGVMIPFRLLKLPDLTPEGTYPLGAVLTTCFILADVNPLLAMTISIVATGLVGVFSAVLYARFKTPPLLLGIILSTIIYSLNLRLMGKPNLAIFTHTTLFQHIPASLFAKLSILAFLMIGSGSLFYQYLLSEKGLAFRAVGLNPHYAQKQGIGLKRYLMLGFFLGNAFAGASGSLMAQLQGYVDINMGVGMVIHALAALMIGEGIMGTKTLRQQLLAPFIGALIYQQIQGLALAVGLQPTDLKLVTGSIVLGLMIMGGKKSCLH